MNTPTDTLSWPVVGDPAHWIARHLAPLLTLDQFRTLTVEARPTPTAVGCRHGLADACVELTGDRDTLTTLVTALGKRFPRPNVRQCSASTPSVVAPSLPSASSEAATHVFA